MRERYEWRTMRREGRLRLLLSYGDERQVTRLGSGTRGRRRVVPGRHTRRPHHLLGHPGVELLPFAQRHDAVAGAGALSHPQDLLRPELQPGRSDHPGLPMHGLDAATRGRPLYLSLIHISEPTRLLSISYAV